MTHWTDADSAPSGVAVVIEDGDSPHVTLRVWPTHARRMASKLRELADILDAAEDRAEGRLN